MSEPIVLYGDARWESPYVFSAFVALREKGLPFELRALSPHDGEHRKGSYPVSSMTGRVPALQHGEFWLAESSAIDEYLEDAFPPPRWRAIYPPSVPSRARARQLQAWLRTDLAAIRDERDSATVFGPPAGLPPLSGRARAEAERLVALCDADLALMLQRLVRNGDPVPERLRRYAEGVWRRPSVREWVDHDRAG